MAAIKHAEPAVNARARALISARALLDSRALLDARARTLLLLPMLLLSLLIYLFYLLSHLGCASLIKSYLIDFIIMYHTNYAIRVLACGLL